MRTCLTTNPASRWKQMSNKVTISVGHSASDQHISGQFCHDLLQFVLNLAGLKTSTILTQFIPSPQPTRATVLPGCLPILTYFTLVGVVSSDVSRSSCTTSFTPCCSIFSQSYVFFQGCPCPLLDVIDVLHPGASPSSFPGIIPRMHVFTRLHLLFLHACPKKAIFLLIIWARNSHISQAETSQNWVKSDHCFSSGLAV